MVSDISKISERQKVGRKRFYTTNIIAAREFISDCVLGAVRYQLFGVPIVNISPVAHKHLRRLSSRFTKRHVIDTTILDVLEIARRIPRASQLNSLPTVFNRIVGIRVNPFVGGDVYVTLGVYESLNYLLVARYVN